MAVSTKPHIKAGTHKLSTDKKAVEARKRYAKLSSAQKQERLKKQQEWRKKNATALREYHREYAKEYRAVRGKGHAKAGTGLVKKHHRKASSHLAKHLHHHKKASHLAKRVRKHVGGSHLAKRRVHHRK